MTPNRRLKQERELRGWSQAKVAEQIGTDATTVSRWERGLFSPTPYFRERLCTLFGKNAKELGLLETGSQFQEKEQQALLERRPRALSPFPHTSLAFQQEKERQQFLRPSISAVAPPIAPSWEQRGDTFAYILDSAAHDQQAHILWEDAYVRAMRGQRVEAQQLGEASLNAFEHVGHANAEALREWLEKNNLTPSPSSPKSTPAAPLPLLPKQPKRTIKHLFQWRNLGLLSLLLAIATISYINFAFNHTTAPNAQAGVHTPSSTQSSSGQKTVLQHGDGVTATAIVSTPTTIVSKPTSVPTSGTSSAVSTPTALPPTFNVTVTPTSLTPANCQPDSGYRCTLTIKLYGNGYKAVNLNWQITSSSLPVQFNPSNGTGEPGQSFQIIAYIQSSPGQSCQLVFTLKSASSTKTVKVAWQG